MKLYNMNFITLIYLILLILTLFTISYLSILEYKRIKKRRFIQLKKEQKYPIVFTQESLVNKINGRYRFSASIDCNTFTNIKTGEIINTENYTGFVIFGNTKKLDMFFGKHGDLVFVKKYSEKEDIIDNYVVIVKNNNYIIKKINRVTKNYAFSDKERISLKTIVGLIEFDFNII